MVGLGLGAGGIDVLGKRMSNAWTVCAGNEN